MTKAKRRMADLMAEFMKDEAIASAFEEVANEEIGAALRVARERMGMSQEEVANRMGVSRPRVSQIEGSEGTGMSLGLLQRFVEALDCVLDIEIRDPHRDEIRVPVYVVSEIRGPSTTAINANDGDKREFGVVLSGPDYANANNARAA